MGIIIPSKPMIEQESLLLFLLLIQSTHAVLFSTKPVIGSTCLHHLETGSAMIFDKGQMEEMVLASKCVQVTQRGVRFISPIQHLRQNGMSSWDSMDCFQNGKNLGGLCSIPSNLSTWNEVLPCSSGSTGSPTYTPKCGTESKVFPLGLRNVLQDVPIPEKQCKSAGDTSGLRSVIPDGWNYDITQCDLHSVGLSMVYLPQSSKIYITHGLELEGWIYIFAGICVIVVVACITQYIVHFSVGSSKPNGYISFGSSIASFCLVLLTMEANGVMVLVTREEVFAFWYLIGYCSLRFVGVVYRIKFLEKKTIQSGDYYNLLVCSLQLLATRIHLTISTPYTSGITFLVGARLFFKLKTKSRIHDTMVLSITMADAMMMYSLCLAGVLPMFSSIMEGYSMCIVLVFACISAARVLPDAPQKSAPSESKKQ